MIRPPAWCEHAVPTAEGWTDPESGEVYISRGFTPEQIASFHGKQVLTEVPAPAPAPEPVVLMEEAPAEPVLEDMSKLELEALGREHGVELDRRKNKKTLIDTLKGII